MQHVRRRHLWIRSAICWPSSCTRFQTVDVGSLVPLGREQRGLPLTWGYPTDGVRHRPETGVRLDAFSPSGVAERAVRGGRASRPLGRPWDRPLLRQGVIRDTAGRCPRRGCSPCAGPARGGRRRCRLRCWFPRRRPCYVHDGATLSWSSWRSRSHARGMRSARCSRRIRHYCPRRRGRRLGKVPKVAQVRRVVPQRYPCAGPPIVGRVRRHRAAAPATVRAVTTDAITTKSSDAVRALIDGHWFGLALSWSVNAVAQSRAVQDRTVSARRMDMRRRSS